MNNLELRFGVGARCLLALLILMSGNTRTAAQTGSNVLVVVNDAAPGGEAIAREYAKRREVPAGSVCHVRTNAVETISRTDFVRQIEEAVWRCGWPPCRTACCTPC